MSETTPRKLGRQPAEETTAPDLKACVVRMDQPPPTSSNDTYGVDHLPEGVETMLAQDKYVVGQALAGTSAVVDHQSLPWIKTTINCFGHLILGVDVPQDWLKAEELLDVETDQFSSPGGTVVVIVGYGPYVGVPDPQMINGPTHGLVEYQAVAWGKMMRLTERALMSTAREAFVVIDRDFYNKGGFDADGFDWDALSKLRPAPAPSPEPEPAPPAAQPAPVQPPAAAPPPPAQSPAVPPQPPGSPPANQPPPKPAAKPAARPPA